jgi:hypothetical protein
MVGGCGVTRDMRLLAVSTKRAAFPVQHAMLPLDDAIGCRGQSDVRDEKDGRLDWSTNCYCLSPTIS